MSRNMGDSNSQKAAEYAAKKRAALEKANKIKSDKKEAPLYRAPPAVTSAGSGASPALSRARTSDCLTARSGLYMSTPYDPAGSCLKLSDRPLMTSDCNRREVCVGGADHSVSVVDLQQRSFCNLFCKTGGHSDWVTGAVFTNSGIVSSGMDGRLCLWGGDRQGEDVCSRWGSHAGQSISRVLADVRGAAVVSLGYDGVVNLWGDLLARPVALLGHDGPVVEACWSSARLCSGGKLGEVLIFDVAGQKAVAKYRAHQGGAVTSCRLWGTAGGPTFASAGCDGFVKGWDSREKGAVLRVPAHCSQEKQYSAAVCCLTVLPQGEGLFVSAGAEGDIVLSDARMGEVWRLSGMAKGAAYSMAAAGEDCVFVGCGDGAVLCIDVKQGKVVYGIGASAKGAVRGIEVSEGKLCAVCEDGNVMIYDYL